MSATRVPITLILAVALVGCDPTGESFDDLALSINVTSYSVPGDDEVSPMIGMDLIGTNGATIKLPVCPSPGPVGAYPVLVTERLDGEEWVITSTTMASECDYEHVTETQSADGSIHPFILTGGPRLAGKYRYWLYVETPDGARKPIYSPELSVVE